MVTSIFTISEPWEYLGPFGIGTREDVWKDSVNAETLGVSPGHWPSTLTEATSWKPSKADVTALERNRASFQFELRYPEIDWDDLVKTYGWAATQFDAWLVGRFNVERDCFVGLQVHNSPEFLLDDIRYEGDIYGLGLPRVLELRTGSHQLKIRVVREVRIFGYQPAHINAIVKLEMEAIEPNQLLCQLEQTPAWLIDVRSTRPSSRYERYRLTNLIKTEVVITRMTYEVRASYTRVMEDRRVIEEETVLAPGQSRSVVLRNRAGTEHTPLAAMMIEVRVSKDDHEIMEVKLGISPRFKPIQTSDRRTPHTITYLNQDNTIGSAILRAPLCDDSVKDSDRNTLPIILALHGAGVDIEDPEWKYIFKDCYHDAWIIQPNCGPWGDDWHSLSALSIDCALHAIDEWIAMNDHQGPKADQNAILVTGHSNGGQGAMQWIVRNSDRLIGAAWAAGYSSIQRYVPYTLWSSNLCVNLERPEYDVAKNVALFAGVKCFVRHGSKDDNVPVYHSRLIKSLAEVELEQAPGQGHWFPGILTEGRLKDFVLQKLVERRIASADTFIVLSWGRPIIKFGIVITQLEHDWICPAVIEVHRHANKITMTTHGVKAWTCLNKELYKNLSLELNGVDEGFFYDFVKTKEYQKVYDRRDLTAILESDGPIAIVDLFGDKDNDFAGRIANSLDLYHALDSTLVHDDNMSVFTREKCNKIMLERTDVPHKFGIWLSQDEHTKIAVLTAHNATQMSRLIRLLPWRTGTGVPGRFWLDDRRAVDKITYSSDVDFEVYLKGQ